MKEVRTRKNPANKWYFIYTDCGKGDITTPMFNTITLAPYSNSLGIYELYAGVCDNVSINETEYFFE
jgi:hypothetical protein